MTRHNTVSYHNVLAESRRCGFQCDTVVVRISRYSTYDDIVTAVQIKCIVVVVVSIHDMDAINAYTVTSQIVLHPTSTILECNIFDSDVTALYETQQMWTCDTLVVPRVFREYTSLTVNGSVAINDNIVYCVGIYQLYGWRMCS